MVTIDLDSVEGIAIGIAHGPLNLEKICESAVAIWKHVKGPRIRILWDLRAARFKLSTNDVRSLAEFIKQHSPPGDLRTAFVVSTVLEFGLVRMFEVLRETASARTMVFRDKEQALEWLASDAA